MITDLFQKIKTIARLIVTAQLLIELTNKEQEFILLTYDDFGL